MQRRDVLMATGAAAGLAGCLGGQGPPDDGSMDTPGDGPSTEFVVTENRCGTQANRASVAFDDGTVTVEGSTWGNDACYTARLDSVTLHGDVLTVRVVAESAAEDGESCAQCITTISYRATVETSSTPGEVVVIHGGETVATASP